MTKKSPTIIFFGNERLATGVSSDTPTLKGLIAAGYNVAGLVINHEKARSRSSRDPEIIFTAKTHKVPVWYAADEDTTIQKIKSARPSAGVLVAYGKIVSTEIIDLFPAGIINIHPSLLPKHRGPTPIESAILAGETVTGVSLMRLSSKMDAGPIYAHCTISVPKEITKQKLTDRLLGLGAELLVKHLSDIINNDLTPQLQDESLATYDNLIKKDDGIIDWKKPANQLMREVIAYSKWPKTTALIGSHKVILTNVDVVNTSGNFGEYKITKDSLIVYAGENALRINRLQPLNKKEMSAAEFLAGYRL